MTNKVVSDKAITDKTTTDKTTTDKTVTNNSMTNNTTTGNTTNQVFTRYDIDNMPQRFRANFVNCLSGFKSANLIGTKSASGNENLAVFSSVVHLGANPPLLGMVLRPHTVRRDTLENIQDTKLYTINHIEASFRDKAHQTSASYDQAENEFEAVGLHAQYLDDFECPFVLESAIKLGMKLVQIIPITHNDTLFVIGEVVNAQLPPSLIKDDGFIALEKANGVCISGLDAYLVPKEPKRFAYAKKDEETSEI